MRCRKCHYRLNDLAEPRCPECGTEFNPEDPATFVTQPPIAFRPIFLILEFIACIVLGSALLLLPDTNESGNLRLFLWGILVYILIWLVGGALGAVWSWQRARMKSE